VLLKLPVDLLWFGGIGTYVKASTESAAEAATGPMTRCASTAARSAPRSLAKAPTWP